MKQHRAAAEDPSESAERMKTSSRHEFLSIDDVQLDVSNPRIAKFLEMYEGEPTAEQLFIALGAGSEDKETDSGPTFNKLKQSIITNGGIIQPIIVNRRDGKATICIDGNTRLALYRSFRDDKVKGSWNTIPAVVYDGLDDEDVDAIRLQAHLVGPRQWDPYSKAKYLTYLRNKQQLPFNKLVDYCGGSKKAVKESIDAYADMEKYYRPLLESDSDFDPRRFSGFVELQKPAVKMAIAKAGFTITDFAKWIHERKIDALAEVRWVPSILKDKRATEIFLKDGAVAASKVLDRPALDKALNEASLGQLARALSQAIRTIQWREVLRLREDPTSDTNQYVREANELLAELIQQLEEDSPDE